MDYFVVAPDGQEYGPANVDTLRSWAQENRLSPTTMLKDFQTGQVLQASAVSGIFPPQAVPPPQVSTPPMAGGPPAPGGGNWAQPPNHYARPNQTRPYVADNGNMDIVWALVRCAVALLFLFVTRYGGLITGIYAVVWAFRAQQKGHRHGPLIIGISLVVMAIVVIGTVIKASQGGNYVGGY